MRLQSVLGQQAPPNAIGCSGATHVFALFMRSPRQLIRVKVNFIAFDLCHFHLCARARRPPSHSNDLVAKLALRSVAVNKHNGTCRGSSDSGPRGYGTDLEQTDGVSQLGTRIIKNAAME